MRGLTRAVFNALHAAAAGEAVMHPSIEALLFWLCALCAWSICSSYRPLLCGECGELHVQSLQVLGDWQLQQIHINESESEAIAEC